MKSEGKAEAKGRLITQRVMGRRGGVVGPPYTPNAAERLNVVLAGMGYDVKRGIWGDPTHESAAKLTQNDIVRDSDHAAHMAKLTEGAEEGDVTPGALFEGEAPYQIDDLGDGQVRIKVMKADGSVIVGVGASLGAAVDALAERVK